MLVVSQLFTHVEIQHGNNVLPHQTRPREVLLLGILPLRQDSERAEEALRDKRSYRPQATRF